MSQRIRVATYNVELDRDGPGLLLRDILRAEDDIAAVADVIASAAPDILAIQNFDHDHDLRALKAFAALLRERSADYPHLFALQPNSGVPTGLDMDGDGRRGGAGDSQGYGAFTGQGGMAILSRFPFDHGGARNFSALPWRDLPGAALPTKDGRPFPSAEAQAVQRLSSVGHWDVPVRLPGGQTLRLLTWHGSTPVFDGPENRNGLRNRDEIRFWQLYLDGAFGGPPDAPFVLLGDANADPSGGEGGREAISRLLSHPLLQDPEPRAARPPTGAAQAGARATADWGGNAGRLRVDYVLPSVHWRVVGSGIAWQAPSGGARPPPSRHGLVWVDIAR